MDSSGNADKAGDPTTMALVQRLRRCGLHVSEESLWIDRHRGLISPLMPAEEGPGRGVSARWQPMSVRRVFYMARLRRRRVNGHVLPLLLFLRDGWGWRRIQPTISEAARKAWEVDRRYLNSPARIHEGLSPTQARNNVLMNTSEAKRWREANPPEDVGLARKWLDTMRYFGEAAPGTSLVPFFTHTVPKVLGLTLGPQQREEVALLTRQMEERRAGLNLSAADVPDWLATLPEATVEQGRIIFLGQVRLLRRHAQQEGNTASPCGGSNPLTFGGCKPTKIAQELRKSPGRVTPAQLLGCMIAQAMVIAAMQ